MGLEINRLTKIQYLILGDWWQNVDTPYLDASDNFKQAIEGISKLVKIAKAHATDEELKEIKHAEFLAKDGLTCYGLEVSHDFFEAGVRKGFDNVELLSNFFEP